MNKMAKVGLPIAAVAGISGGMHALSYEVNGAEVLDHNKVEACAGSLPEADRRVAKLPEACMPFVAAFAAESDTHAEFKPSVEVLHWRGSSNQDIAPTTLKTNTTYTLSTPQAFRNIAHASERLYKKENPWSTDIWMGLGFTAAGLFITAAYKEAFRPKPRPTQKAVREQAA